MAAAYDGDECSAQEVIARLHGTAVVHSASVTFPVLPMSELVLHEMPPDGDCFFGAMALGIALTKGTPVVDYARRAMAGETFRMKFLSTISSMLHSGSGKIVEGLGLSVRDILLDAGRFGISSILGGIVLVKFWCAGAVP